MRDSSLFVFILAKARDDLIPCTQDVSFSLFINTPRDQVWMSHPIQVLHSAS